MVNKTRNSYSSCVNRIMKPPELMLQIKLERQSLDWREIDKQINELVRNGNATNTSNKA
jgi:hypothetical protein